MSSAATLSTPAQLASATARATARTPGSAAPDPGRSPVAALPEHAARYSAQIHSAASCTEAPQRVAATASAAGPHQQITPQMKLSGTRLSPSGFPRHVRAVTDRNLRPWAMHPIACPALWTADMNVNQTVPMGPRRTSCATARTARWKSPTRFE